MAVAIAPGDWPDKTVRMMMTANKPLIVARARIGNPPVKDAIASAIISLLSEIKRGKRAKWSPEGIAWKDIYLRACRLYYDGRQCRHDVVDGSGGNSGIPPGPAADIFNEYCSNLLDALASLHQATVSQSLHVGYAGIIWQTPQGGSLAIELHVGGLLTAVMNPRPLATETRGLMTYSVWD